MRSHLVAFRKVERVGIRVKGKVRLVNILKSLSFELDSFDDVVFHI